MFTPSNPLSDSGVCAGFYSRLQYLRWIGFQGFVLNKAFAVSPEVPVGHVWLVMALSALHINSNTRILHLFAVPPGDAGGLANVSSDVASPFFKGANNNPPLASGVLLSVGGSAALSDQQSVSSSSVSGLIAPFILPERWKILCCIDSTEAVTNPSADGIFIDAALIDVTRDECIPDNP